MNNVYVIRDGLPVPIIRIPPAEHDATECESLYFSVVVDGITLLSVDGLIAMVVSPKDYRPSEILKWKPIHKQTIEFAVDVDPSFMPFYRLTIGGCSSYVQRGRVHPATSSSTGVIEAIGARLRDKQPCIAECVYIPAEDVWDILDLRHDKNHPNDVVVLLDVMKEHIVHVSRRELLETCLPTESHPDAISSALSSISSSLTSGAVDSYDPENSGGIHTDTMGPNDVARISQGIFDSLPSSLTSLLSANDPA